MQMCVFFWMISRSNKKSHEKMVTKKSHEKKSRKNSVKTVTKKSHEKIASKKSHEKMVTFNLWGRENDRTLKIWAG